MDESNETEPKEPEYFFGGLIKINLSELAAVASSDPMFIEKGPSAY